MTPQDHEWLTHELERYADVVDFMPNDNGAIHSLAINMDNAQAQVRDIRVKLALQRAQALVRDAHHCLVQGEDEVASEMLGLAQYWLAKAKPTA